MTDGEVSMAAGGPLWRRLVPGAVKTAVLLGGVAGLWGFYHLRTAADLPVMDDDDVQVSPLVTVQTGKVERATVRSYADGYGVVEAEPARNGKPPAGADVVVPPLAAVASVDVGEGQRVAAGQTLVTLDRRSAEAAVARATAATAAADKVAQAMAGGQGIDAARADQAAADAAADLAHAQAERDSRTVVSPIAGTIVALDGRPGGTVRVADLSRLVVAVEIPATALADVHVGSPAVVTVDGTDAPGTVTFVDPGVDPATGEGSVDVSGVSGLRLGQTVRVRVVTAEHRDVLTVPTESLVEDADGAASVRSVERDFRWAVRVPVTAGLRDGDHVEVAGDGIRDGQDVVTVGAFALPDHSRIEVAK
jgi:RND family efflux transporter MFP subunit